MTKIITFPLKFVSDYRDKIKAGADKKHLSMNKFILKLIDDELKREQ